MFVGLTLVRNTVKLSIVQENWAFPNFKILGSIKCNGAKIRYLPQTLWNDKKITVPTM